MEGQQFVDFEDASALMCLTHTSTMQNKGELLYMASSNYQCSYIYIVL